MQTGPANADADAGSEAEQPTDDLDDEPAARGIGDGALLRDRRMLTAKGVCVLPVGAYNLAAAPTQSSDGQFWRVSFATEPKGVGGAACGTSGWVESGAVQFRQIAMADSTPPARTPGATSCDAETGFRASYIKPVHGPVTGHFGDCRDGCRRKHAGVDIAASTGTPVLAAEDGVVIDTGTGRGACGTVIEVRHPNGASTRFCHNSKLLVRKGECVRRGQKIAEVGNTGIGSGPHMHLEFYPSPTGGAVNPKGVFGY
jgi:murein DD-endopeptidase MepM/ murein hydrolase activator NlpD